MLLGESVTLESGKQFKLTVTVGTSGRLGPSKNESPATKQPADETPPPMIDRSRFTKRSGQWHLEGDELLQTTRMGSYSELFFGDIQWTDYDFTVDAMHSRRGELILFVLPQHGS